MTQDTRVLTALRSVVDYCWDDEKIDYEECDAEGRQGHIYESLIMLSEYLNPAHADYPHEPGALYDCPACEARCYCAEGLECVYCDISTATTADRIIGTYRRDLLDLYARITRVRDGLAELLATTPTPAAEAIRAVMTPLNSLPPIYPPEGS